LVAFIIAWVRNPVGVWATGRTIDSLGELIVGGVSVSGLVGVVEGASGQHRHEGDGFVIEVVVLVIAGLWFEVLVRVVGGVADAAPENTVVGHYTVGPQGVATQRTNDVESHQIKHAIASPT
jgi:hypothetical protein